MNIFYFVCHWIMLRKCKLRKNLCLQLITLAIAKICMSLCAVTAEPSMSSVVELCGWIKMQPDRQQQQHAERIYSTPALSPWRHTNKEYCGRKMSVIRTHTHTHTHSMQLVTVFRKGKNYFLFDLYAAFYEPFFGLTFTVDVLCTLVSYLRLNFRMALQYF